MIGILGAFGLDSWYEARIATFSQNEALQKLVLDLENDIIRFQSLDSLYLLWNDQAEHILEDVLDASKNELEFKEYVVGRGSMNYLTIR